MPVRPQPVRYLCTQCKHDWVWAPASDVLFEPPGTCPRCGGRSTAVETGWRAQLPWPLNDLLTRRK